MTLQRLIRWLVNAIVAVCILYVRHRESLENAERFPRSFFGFSAQNITSLKINVAATTPLSASDDSVPMNDPYTLLSDTELDNSMRRLRSLGEKQGRPAPRVHITLADGMICELFPGARENKAQNLVEGMCNDFCADNAMEGDCEHSCVERTKLVPAFEALCLPLKETNVHNEL